MGDATHDNEQDVESVEMYHYNGAPASAEKKVVVAESDIKTLYDMFKGLSLKDKTAEETAGADVTSFRFNLSDGTSYDLIYACYGAKNGNLKSEAGGFAYFTSADIGSYWNNLHHFLLWAREALAFPMAQRIIPTPYLRSSAKIAKKSLLTIRVKDNYSAYKSEHMKPPFDDDFAC